MSPRPGRSRRGRWPEAGGADDHGDAAVAAGLEPVAHRRPGAVKSIKTCGVSGLSKVMGSPMGPMPAISPASFAGGTTGRSTPGFLNAPPCRASAINRVPIRPAVPVIATVVMQACPLSADN